MSRLAFRISLAFSLIALACTGALSDEPPPVQVFSFDNYATAPYENASGYGFAYESTCMSPGTDGEAVYYDWWYTYYLENDSLDHAILRWDWTDGAWIGPVMPGVHVGTNVYEGSSDMPLPYAPEPNLATSYTRNEDFSDLDEMVQLQSIITWDDGHTEQVPIYAPSGYRESMGGSPVPEPGGVLALLTGLLGVAGLARRKQV